MPPSAALHEILALRPADVPPEAYAKDDEAIASRPLNQRSAESGKPHRSVAPNSILPFRAVCGPGASACKTSLPGPCWCLSTPPPTNPVLPGDAERGTASLAELGRNLWRPAESVARWHTREWAPPRLFSA